MTLQITMRLWRLVTISDFDLKRLILFVEKKFKEARLQEQQIS